MKADINKKIIKYHRQRWRHIHAKLKSFIKNKNDDDLHELRVEIKKISALYHFIECYSNHFTSKKELTSLQKIFKLTGKVRDYRNGKKLCAEFNTGYEAFKKDEKNQKRYISKLNHCANKHQHKLKVAQLDANRLLKHLQDHQIKKHLNESKAKLVQILTQNPNGKTLHETRKKIKELYYLAELAQQERRGVLNAADLKKLDALQDHIGQWHDINKFCQTVQHYKFPEQEYGLIPVIEKEQRISEQIRKLSYEWLRLQKERSSLRGLSV
jgi:CHAD domain-containing protein